MRIILASGSPRRRELLQQAGVDFEVVVSDADETVEGEPHVQVATLARRKAEAVAALLREQALEGNTSEGNTSEGNTSGENTPGETSQCTDGTSDVIIVAADTLVAIEGFNGCRLLGKPVDADDAFNMLSMLQGRKHTVYTGVAMLRMVAAGNDTTAGNSASLGNGITAGNGATIVKDDCTVFVDAAYVFFRPLSVREIRAYIATGEPFDKAGAYGIQEKGALLVERVEGDFYTVMGLPISKLCVQLEEMGVDVWG